MEKFVFYFNIVAFAFFAALALLSLGRKSMGECNIKNEKL